MTSSDQNEELGRLGFRANSAGLAGAAVAVWDAGGGRMVRKLLTPLQSTKAQLKLANSLANHRTE